MDKKFFQILSALNITDKIAQINSAAMSNAQKNDLIQKSILRDNLRNEVKLQLLTQQFGEQADEIMYDYLNDYKLPTRNRIKLRKYIASHTSVPQLPFLVVDNSEADSAIKEILKAVTAFLCEKRNCNEAVSVEDSTAIEGILQVKSYRLYRDQMNGIIHQCFRFKGQRIKAIAAEFLNRVLVEYNKVEVSILFNLLEGDYISPEMAKILRSNADLIRKEGLMDKVLDELYRIKGETLTQKGKGEIQTLISYLSK